MESKGRTPVPTGPKTSLNHPIVSWPFCAGRRTTRSFSFPSSCKRNRPSITEARDRRVKRCRTRQARGIPQHLHMNEDRSQASGRSSEFQGLLKPYRLAKREQRPPVLRSRLHVASTTTRGQHFENDRTSGSMSDPLPRAGGIEPNPTIPNENKTDHITTNLT